MWVVVIAAAVAWMASGMVRRHAISHSMLDYPNDRSSHSEPTPRGGGLGLLTGVVVAVAVGGGSESVDWRIYAASAGVVLAAFVGWLDDRYSLSVRIRLVAHLLAGCSFLPLTLIPGPVPVSLGAAAGLWWVFWAVSAINVVNFMDGIDGLIGLQAIIFGVHLVLSGSPGGLPGTLGLSLAGASVGFLAWNWAPARMFLGDVGSGSLGLLFVLGGVLLMREGRSSLVTAFLPLYPLFLDASVTLLGRIRRGERWIQAHRNHMYQRLANESWDHARVSVLYGCAAAIGAAAARVSEPTVSTVVVVSYLFMVPLAAYAIRRKFIVHSDVQRT